MYWRHAHCYSCPVFIFFKYLSCDVLPFRISLDHVGSILVGQKRIYNNMYIYKYNTVLTVFVIRNILVSADIFLQADHVAVAPAQTSSALSSLP